MTRNILIVVGTRPEMIKMAPLVLAARRSAHLDVKLCITAQHRNMLDPLLDLFGLKADFDLDVMRSGQNLYDITTKVLAGVGHVIREWRPDCVIVHGDTTTTFASSLAAYYERVAVGHVEAGLRTGNIYSPWPEEANRKLVSALACYNFAPTANARDNLLREGVPAGTIHVTGNTVIDALFHIHHKIQTDDALSGKLSDEFHFLDPNKRLVLVTAHRRENFGQGMINICEALREIASSRPDVQILYPVHPNPNVQGPVRKHLEGVPNIFLIGPVDYQPFVYLMGRAHLIVTDSGGVQEEAPSLGKPVLVMRDTTERPEAVEVGTVRLVGAVRRAIVTETMKLLDNSVSYEKMSRAHNPYGDGHAVARIVTVMERGDRVVPVAI